MKTVCYLLQKCGYIAWGETWACPPRSDQVDSTSQHKNTVLVGGAVNERKGHNTSAWLASVDARAYRWRSVPFHVNTKSAQLILWTNKLWTLCATLGALHTRWVYTTCLTLYYSMYLPHVWLTVIFLWSVDKYLPRHVHEWFHCKSVIFHAISII